MPLDRSDPEQYPQISTKEIARKLRPYAKANDKLAIKELAITAIGLITLWNLMWLSLSVSYFLTLLLALPAGGFLIRLFIIQHDCGHYSFFSTRKANNRVGRVLGIFTYSPYEDWRRDHALHHAWTGNLDHRGLGDIKTLTLQEYKDRKGWARLRYRIFRHPLFLFLIFPLYQFILRHRWPCNHAKGWQPLISTMTTNLAIAVSLVAMGLVVGWRELALVLIPLMIVGTSLGVWLFFIQHQFEETVWDRNEDWDMRDAAFHGSSFYDLPRPLAWITGNIGAHHIHHVSSRVPFYHLRDALDNIPELHEVPKLTLKQSLQCFRFALWDEEKKELLSFKEAGVPAFS